VLKNVLDASPLGTKTYLETEYGVPFTANGFGGWFRDRCNEADLHVCTAHALRRAGATFAAENGATVSQLMAILGWATAKAGCPLRRGGEPTKDRQLRNAPDRSERWMNRIVPLVVDQVSHHQESQWLMKWLVGRAGLEPATRPL
jgi:hypothetical protein